MNNELTTATHLSVSGNEGLLVLLLRSRLQCFENKNRS